MPKKPKVKRKLGRPSKHSAAMADRICARLAQGESLRSICSSEGMPTKSTVMRWLGAYEDFRDQYASAREAQADFYAEEIIEISDGSERDTYTDAEGRERVDNEVVQRAKLRVDTRKWLMARMAPKKYGDKVTTEHTGNLTITHEQRLALLDAE